DLRLLLHDGSHDQHEHARDDRDRQEHGAQAARLLRRLGAPRLLAALLERHQVEASHLSPTFLSASPMPTVRNGATDIGSSSPKRLRAYWIRASGLAISGGTAKRFCRNGTRPGVIAEP